MRTNTVIYHLVVHMYVCLLMVSTSTLASAMAPQSLHHRVTMAPTRRETPQSCTFSSINNIRGGKRGEEIVVYKLDPWYQIQQKYIGLSLAVLLFPSITWRVIQIASTVAVVATIINAIEGNGLVIVP